MKIVSIVGARPQFIKAALVSRALRACPGVLEVLVHTGQHYDHNLSDLIFYELEIPRADFHLGIGSGLHGAQTGKMLEAVERLLLDQRPECVLVYGDTNSTLAGAVSATKAHISVAHIEAGLRSFNRRMPEEINRILTDHCSDLLLAPSLNAVENLRQEGIPDQRIHLVGDVMYDVVRVHTSKAQAKSTILRDLRLVTGSYVLATVHRAENTDDLKRLRSVFEGLCAVAEEVPLVFPLHPRTRKVLQELDDVCLPAGFQLIEPVGYLDMLTLEKHARVIATDSGGVQKEAFYHRVPCVTLREETEWVELVQLGWSRLAPPHDPAIVHREVMRAYRGEQPSRSERGEPTPFGTGHAAEAIRDVILTRGSRRK